MDRTSDDLSFEEEELHPEDVKISDHVYGSVEAERGELIPVDGIVSEVDGVLFIDDPIYGLVPLKDVRRLRKYNRRSANWVEIEEGQVFKDVHDHDTFDYLHVASLGNGMYRWEAGCGTKCLMDGITNHPISAMTDAESVIDPIPRVRWNNTRQAKAGEYIHSVSDYDVYVGPEIEGMWPVDVMRKDASHNDEPVVQASFDHMEAADKFAEWALQHIYTLKFAQADEKLEEIKYDAMMNGYYGKTGSLDPVIWLGPDPSSVPSDIKGRGRINPGSWLKLAALSLPEEFQPPRHPKPSWRGNPKVVPLDVPTAPGTTPLKIHPRLPEEKPFIETEAPPVMQEQVRKMYSLINQYGNVATEVTDLGAQAAKTAQLYVTQLKAVDEEKRQRLAPVLSELIPLARELSTVGEKMKGESEGVRLTVDDLTFLYRRQQPERVLPTGKKVVDPLFKAITNAMKELEIRKGEVTISRDRVNLAKSILMDAYMGVMKQVENPPAYSEIRVYEPHGGGPGRPPILKAQSTDPISDLEELVEVLHELLASVSSMTDSLYEAQLVLGEAVPEEEEAPEMSFEGAELALAAQKRLILTDDQFSRIKAILKDRGIDLEQA
jgi:hypothetical protein